MIFRFALIALVVFWISRNAHWSVVVGFALGAINAEVQAYLCATRHKGKR